MALRVPIVLAAPAEAGDKSEKLGGNKMKERFKRFSEKFGEGTSWDLDYGKLVIIGLLIYHIFIQ